MDFVGVAIWGAILWWLAYAIREYWRAVRPRLEVLPGGPRRLGLTTVAILGAPIFAVAYFFFAILATPSHRYAPRWPGDPSASREARRIGESLGRIEDEAIFAEEIGPEQPMDERVIDRP